MAPSLVALGALVLMAAAASRAIGGPPSAHDMPGKIDLEATEYSAMMRGWPVIADGEEIGAVTYLLIDSDGEVVGVRARVRAHLGLGERLVDIPSALLSLTRDAVVLHLSAQELDDAPPAGNVIEDRP
jgi:hypothetical protein